ncbi:MAG: beta-ketoacyl synthase N-terminal-like domain-containing protein, partial [Stackebrandtia sp.]
PEQIGDIAVIGISGRYPMAEDLDAFWRNLADGRDCVTEIPPERWPLDGFYAPVREPHRSYSKWGGFLSDIDKFDPLFFNIAPHEAEMMDPQERVFLETVWHVLEDAGYTRATLAGANTGVFVGVMYGQYQLLGMADDGRMGVSSYASIANRVSYFFDFHGPSMAMDTMCSSSLTAIHLACESLRRGECETAVAGGVNLTVHPQKYLQLSLARFASSDGKCRSFGAEGDGYVPGEGVGALLLKPLPAALADGDNVHAVIRSSAVNHGGKTNGYTVPNPRAQRMVVSAALRRAEVGPADVGYIETHGTGTALGDPIEVAALAEAYGASGRGPDRIPIGSVKSTIGHLESAAGIAAVTKAILQIRHRAVAPSLHADRLNPNIDFANSGLYVATQLAEWKPNACGQWIAGVSSFGAGGANAHLVLASQQDQDSTPDSGERQVLVLSAKSHEQLTQLAGRLADHLQRRLPPGDARQSLAADVLTLLHDVLGLRPGDLGLGDPLAEAGFDQVARARLGAGLAEVYGLPSDDLPEELNTAAEIAEHLHGRHGQRLRSDVDTAAGDFGVHLPAGELRLADVAYTLQVGRESMAARFACVAADLPAAVAQLRAVATGEQRGGSSFTGQVPRPGAQGDVVAMPFADEAGRQYLRALVRDRAVDRIAELWVQGAHIEWHGLYDGQVRRRVPLVDYPFARERCWLETTRLDWSPDRPAAPREAITSENGSSPDVAGPERVRGPEKETPMRPMQMQTEIRSTVQRELVVLAAAAIGLDVQRFDPHTSLADYGFDSMALKDLADRIAGRFGVPLTPVVFFERPGIAGITGWLLDEHGDQVEAVVRAVAPDPSPGTGTGWSAPSANGVTAVLERHAEPRIVADAAVGLAAPDVAAAHEPIAIIGMSGRFPGSPTLDRFWENLRDRRDLVTEIPEERWNWRELDNDDLPPEQRCKFRWGAFIEDVDKFDPLFFGISPAEAEMMDPQQRILLQSVWAAIEDAGYRPSELSGEQVGLFAGVQFSDYQHLLHEAGVLNAQAALGNEHSITVNRVSYLLNLHGPSEPINTACSSSLVAVHHAVRSLRCGESSVAVAGGIALNLAAHSTVAAGLMGLLSPDGRCKTLDRSANGYVKGEGVGVLVLKPLRAATADGDHIYAVIKGTAVNHGGRAASLTAPNPEAQAALLRAAIEEADVDPDTIGYLELHGTGTELCDPIVIS